MIAALGVAAAPTISRADYFAFAVARQVTYTQDAAAQPSTPEFWGVLALLYNDVPNEVLSATLKFNVPPPASYAMNQTNPTLFQFASTFFTTEAAFLADFPATTYTIEADRGLGVESGSVFLDADLYCTAIPYFTGDTFTRLNSYDTADTFGATINGFTINPGADTGSTSIVIVEENVGTAFSIALEPTDTDFLIPAGTLHPNTNYSISISYVNDVVIPNAGFGDVTGQAEFTRSTTAYFTTLPEATACCPGDFNNDRQVNGLDVQSFVNALLSGENCP